MNRSLTAICFTAGVISAMATRPAHAARVAQQAATVITGVATDVRSKQPLAGVSVTIVGTRYGAITDNAGRFRIAGAPNGSQTLFVKRISYATQRRSAVLGAEAVTVNFELEPAASVLDEVVVTGTVGGELRRTIGNSVATINADDAVSKSSTQSLSGLIGARAPGVIIAPSTGRLGS